MTVRPESLTEDDLPATFGRFELTRVLGEGSMGRVFAADMLGPSGFRKKTALKVLRRSVGADSVEFRQSLIREARIGAHLKHPNVVEIYDFGEVDEIPWISMELVDGVGLDELARRRALSPAQALDVIIGVCDALEYITDLEVDGERLNLVHRDLKPSNVIVGRDGTVKVLDFGIAKAAFLSGIATASGHTRGTPSYMSPEQTRGLDLDVRSDLFAVATCLYLLITGRHLFAGGSVIEVMTAIVKVDRRLKSRATWLGVEESAPGLRQVLLRALAFDPADRYPTAGALRAALLGVRAGVDDGSTLSNLTTTVNDETLNHEDHPPASLPELELDSRPDVDPGDDDLAGQTGDGTLKAPALAPSPERSGPDWPVLLASAATIVGVVALVVWIARSL